MADFEQAYTHVMKVEGGYANNAADRGGETWKGIARKKHPNWAGWQIIDGYKNNPSFPSVLDSDTQLRSLKLSFYKKEFWDKLSGDGIKNQSIARELFDTAVNMGPGVAAGFLQRSLNVTNRNGKDYADITVDHAIGPKTIATLNAHARPGDVYKAMNCLQGAKYIDICEANPSQEVFFSGWMTRVFEA